jgi:hypothetical protein
LWVRLCAVTNGEGEAEESKQFWICNLNFLPISNNGAPACAVADLLINFPRILVARLLPCVAKFKQFLYINQQV